MKYTVLILTICFALLQSCGEKKSESKDAMASLSPQEQQELFDRAKQIFGVLPDKMPGGEKDSPALIALGKKLYFETKLSVNGTLSCNSCHNIINAGGADTKPLSDGALPGTKGTRNSNTVLNAGFQFVQFWDGREKDLKEQAKGPILNPVEMAMKDEKAVEKAISSIPGYKELFSAAYPKEAKTITFDNIANAIAAFERTLISKSRYDDYITGNKDGLTEMEMHGLKMFIETGCITCHTGPLFGGNIYQKMGLVHPYENTKDLGRFEVTKNEADKYMFKVPLLRNIAVTGPYFHDGAVASLADAVKKMGYLSLGKDLKPDEIDHIVLFLKALTDKNLEKTVAKK